VEIEEGIDGLIHISDISWTKRIYHPREVIRKNQEVEAIVLSIDRALHRIALGVKQLHIDPWQELDRKLPVNTEVIGKVSKLIPKGVLVDVTVGEDVVEGFVPISHLAIPKLERSEDAFFVGEDVPLKVIELDMENRRLILSVRAFFFSREPRLQEEFIALHENFMRERIVKMNKKKQEKESREKALKEKIKQETEERLAQEKADLDKAFSTDGQVPEPTAEEPAVELAPLEVEQPAEEPAVEPVPLEAEQPAEEPAVEPAPLEAEQPAEEPTVEPAPLEVEQPAEEPTVEPAPLEVEQPAEEPTVEPAPLEAEQPAEEPVEEIQAVIPAVVEEPVVPETIPEEEVPAAETLQDNEPKQ
ncbi:MAG: S1 RNA-binding domain-containing protein, partial [Candidatus Cloacimonetes bacterium]|nr:S1 RNA-binding domain-containing protein [Candidatus Cloacimonadota bacterium]